MFHGTDWLHEEDIDLLEWVQRRLLRWSKGWSTSAMMKGWRSWVCSAWRREGSGGIERISSMCINTWICGENEDEGSRLFSLMPTERPRSNGQNMKLLKFHLNVRKQFYCEICQREITMEIFKSYLDAVLGNLLWLVLREKGSWSRWSQEVPPSLNRFTFL